MNNKTIQMAVAFACAVYFAIASIAIHFLRPEIRFISNPLSRYAIGEFSIILTIGLIGIGLCEIIIGIHTKNSFVGSLLMVLAGISVVIVGLFKMDTGGTVTVAGQIHVLAALSEFMFYPIAVFFIGRTLPFGAIKLYSFVTSFLTMSLLLLLMLLFNNNEIRIFGLIQKINIFAITAWLLVMSGNKIMVEKYSRCDC